MSENMEKKETYVHYAAIASMMNPTSMKLRGMKPIKAVPGVLLDYKVEFFAPSGMADTRHDPGCEFSHVVVYTMTQEDMTALDKVEATYFRTPCKVRLYDNSIMEAVVYTQPKDEELKIGIPSERYIDIMTRGCKHHGVKQEYIDFLLNHENVPRKNPENFLSIEVSDDLPTWTRDQLAEHLTNEFPKPIYTCVNKKIIRLDTVNSHRWEKIYRKYTGKDITLTMTHMLFEPKYPVANTIEDMIDEQKAFVEDMICSFLVNDPTIELEAVGLIRD